MADLTDDVLVTLRRIIRANDLHSRKLGRETGLTTPQLVVMRAIEAAGAEAPTVSEISRRVSLSQATVTNILNRLEGQKLVRRQRSETDKRRVNLSVTPAGRKLLHSAPQPLQEGFIVRFNQLADWEQHLIVSSLARVAAMMDAEDLDAAPLLAPGEEVR
ncbi:MAG: MarR family winged helix-turn-helix transcriptional regulator [Pseudomonadales bacterium]